MATEACKKGHVAMDDSKVKASKEIKSGDIIEVKKHPIWRTYRILDIPKSRVGAKLVPDFVEEMTTAEELEKFEMLQLAKKQDRSKWGGRPTKKERRDINKFMK